MFAVKTSNQFVIGMELATQKQYAQRHGIDPNWSFIDGSQFWDQDEVSAFMTNPAMYYVDDIGILRYNYPLTATGPTAPQQTVGTFLMNANLSGFADTSGKIPGIAGTDYPILSQTEFTYLAGKGIKQIRLPGLWGRVQPGWSSWTPGNPYPEVDPTYIGYFINSLNYANNLRMGVLVDIMHNYGRLTINGTNQVFGDGVLTPDMFADAWRQIAKKLVGLPGLIGYDLMNEPRDLPGGSATWQAFAQAAITAIRTVDQVTPIYVEGYQYASAFAWVQNNPTLQNLIDPSNKLVFEAHTYLDRDSSGSHFIWAQEVAAGDQLTSPVSTLDANIGVKRVAPFIAWLEQYKLQGVIGELGVGNNDPQWNIALSNVLAVCKSAGVPVFYFTAGPYYKNYPMGIEPTGSTDTRQIAVLCQYAGVPDIATTYLLTGPTRGTTATVSTPFGVDVRGIITKSFVVTPNDLGAGGTFAPTSLTVPAGDNFYGTFTYTASATAKTATIACTNTGGLVDAPAIGYSTRNDIFVQTGLTANNILWPTLMDTTHITPAVTLYRVSDGAVQDFYFVNDQVDQASIALWAGSSSVSIKEAWDQGPHKNNAGPIDGDNTASSTNTALLTAPSQYPTYVLNGANDLPLLRFATSKMDVPCAINALAGLTVIFAVNPKTIGDGRCMISWAFLQDIYLTDANGNYVISTEATPNQPAGLIPGSLNVYTMVFDGVGELRSAFVNGKLLGTQAASQAVLTFVDRSNFNLGYFRFYNDPVNFDLFGYVIFQQALTPQQLSVFHTRMVLDAGVVHPGTATGLTLNGSITTNSIPVILPLVPLNTTTLLWQTRLSGDTAWTTATTQTVTSGQEQVTYTYSNLSPNTSYDVQVVPAYGNYVGTASQLLAQQTLTITQGSGKPIQFIGMNIGGLDLDFSFTQNQAYIQHFVSLGFNIFRIPFKWETMQPTLGGTIDPAYVANMMNYVNLGTQLQVQILLDMHNYSKYNGNQMNAAGGPTTAQLSNCWVQIATTPGILNNPYIRLGIMNEPTLDEADWHPIHNQIVSDLRAAGVTNWVHAAPKTGGMLNVGSINDFTDSLNKTYFEGHLYTDSTGAGTSSILQPNIANYIGDACRVVQLYRTLNTNVLLHWGEVGFDYGPVALQSLKMWLDYVQQNSDIFSGITFWCAGQEFNDEYIYDMNPSKGVDQQQTLIAREYLPGGARCGYNAPIIAYQAQLYGSTVDSYSAAGTGPFPNSAQGSVWEQTAMMYTPFTPLPTSLYAFTLETMFCYLGGTFVAGTIIGKNGSVWVTTSGTTAWEFRTGNSPGAIITTISVAQYMDGKAHHLEYGADATGFYIFIDGVLKGYNKTPFASTTPTMNFALGIRSNGNAGSGSTSYGLGNVAFWTYLRHNAAFSPPTDYYTGMEKGLIGFFPLNGNLNGLL